jgi:hypothetical protein
VPLVIEAHLAMRAIRERCEKAIAGWGNLVTEVRSWERRVNRIKQDLAPLHCLGLTKLGHPKHPLYLPYDVEIIPYE